MCSSHVLLRLADRQTDRQTDRHTHTHTHTHTHAHAHTHTHTHMPTKLRSPINRPPPKTFNYWPSDYHKIILCSFGKRIQHCVYLRLGTPFSLIFQLTKVRFSTCAAKTKIFWTTSRHSVVAGEQVFKQRR
jgi:hypothetical protein